MKLTDKQYRDAIDWVVTAQRGRFPIERGHIDAIADILLSPKEKAADVMFDALRLYARYAPLSGDMALLIRASQGGGEKARQRADSLIQHYEHLDEARDKAIAALVKADQP